MKNKLLLFSVLFLLFVSSSCGEDGGNSCDTNDLTNDIADELTTFENAATAYASDPSDANCLAWKNAGTAYINAADQFVQDCEGITPSEYNVAVQGALNALASLPCS